MKIGDLVEIYFPDVPNATGIYLEADYNSAWRDGEEEKYTRAMILWDSDIISVPINQFEVLHESK